MTAALSRACAHFFTTPGPIGFSIAVTMFLGMAIVFGGAL